VPWSVRRRPQAADADELTMTRCSPRTDLHAARRITTGAGKLGRSKLGLGKVGLGKLGFGKVGR